MKACKNNDNKYYLGEEYAGAYFTYREAECALLLVNHYNNVQIAKYLNISILSVQFFIKQMQAKVSAPTRQDLIDIILNSSFLNQLDFNLHDLCAK